MADKKGFINKVKEILTGNHPQNQNKEAADKSPDQSIQTDDVFSSNAAKAANQPSTMTDKFGRTEATEPSCDVEEMISEKPQKEPVEEEGVTPAKTGDDVSESLAPPIMDPLSGKAADVTSGYDTGPIDREGPAERAAAATEAVIREADLGVVKSVTIPFPPERPNVGDEVTFLVSVTNHGPHDALEVSTEDKLPEGMEFVSAEVSSEDDNYDPSTGIWTIGTLANGETVTLALVGRILESGYEGVTNIAVVSSPTPEPEPVPGEPNFPNEASVDVNPLYADLAVTKTVPAQVLTDEVFTYTITIENKGIDPAEGVKLEDGLPAGFHLLETEDPEEDGVEVSSGTYSIEEDSQGGQFILWNVGEIAEEEIFTLTVTGSFSEPSSEGGYENKAEITENSPYDPGIFPNSAEATVVVDQRTADLSITKAVSNITPDVDEVITYTVTVTNHGGDKALGVIVTEVLPSEDDIIFDDIDPGSLPPGVSYDPDENIWTIDELEVGDSIDLVFTGTVQAPVPDPQNPYPYPQPFTNIATVSSVLTEDLNITGDNTASETVTPQYADLAITKIAPEDVIIGEQFEYIIEVENLGAHTAKGVEVSDTLPEGFEIAQGLPVGVVVVEGVLTWDVGDLEGGMTETLTIIGQFNGEPGSFSNIVSVGSTGGTFDPNLDNNDFTVDTTAANPQQAPVVLNIVANKSDIAEDIEESVTYTITVSGEILEGSILSTTVVITGSADGDGVGGDDDYTPTIYEAIVNALPEAGMSFNASTGLLELTHEFDGSFSFTVSAVDDQAVEGIENIIVTLDNPLLTDSTVIPGPDGLVASVNITELDSDIELNISAEPLEISEEDGETGTFTITMVGGPLEEGNTAAVKIPFPPVPAPVGIATDGVDYTNTIYNALSNAAGLEPGVDFSTDPVTGEAILTFDHNFDGSLSFSITALDDDDAEGLENVVVSLTEPMIEYGSIIIGTDSATIGITETDTGVLFGELVINEIGLGNGTSPTVIFSQEGEEDEIIASEENLNFIELRNVDTTPLKLGEMRLLQIEIVGTDGTKSVINLDGGFNVNWGGDWGDNEAFIAGQGYLVLYENSPNENDSPWDGTWKVTQAGGGIRSLGTWSYAEGSSWGFGEDTTQPLGVNLLERQPDLEQSPPNYTGVLYGVDLFVANDYKEQDSYVIRPALTDGLWYGEGTGSEDAKTLLGSDADLIDNESFNGKIGEEPYHVFARVFNFKQQDAAPIDTHYADDWTTTDTPTQGGIEEDERNPPSNLNDTIIGGTDETDPNQGANVNKADAGQTVWYASPEDPDYILNPEAKEGATDGRGPDFLYGDDEQNIIEGGAHNDFIFGGGEADDLDGGTGSDFIAGGTGSDRFKFVTADGSTDTIMDFELGLGPDPEAKDVLDLSDMLTDVNNESNITTIASYFINISAAGGNTTIDIDTDADALPNHTIVLQNVDLISEFGTSDIVLIIQGLIDNANLDLGEP
jgi:uncharacterized repeat protein (TIGR01451 family)